MWLAHLQSKRNIVFQKGSVHLYVGGSIRKRILIILLPSTLRARSLGQPSPFHPSPSLTWKVSKEASLCGSRSKTIQIKRNRGLKAKVSKNSETWSSFCKQGGSRSRRKTINSTHSPIRIFGKRGRMRLRPKHGKGQLFSINTRTPDVVQQTKAILKGHWHEPFPLNTIPKRVKRTRCPRVASRRSSVRSTAPEVICLKERSAKTGRLQISVGVTYYM